MEIVPILQTFRFNKSSLALVIVQLAFTLAVLVNALVIIDAYRTRLGMDSGVDDRALAVVEVEPVDHAYFSDEGRVRNDVQQDLEALGRLDGVTGVTQLSSFPLSGEGAMRASWPQGGVKEKAARHTLYAGDAQALSTLGLNLIAGRAFTAEETDWSRNPTAGSSAGVVIVSRALAEALFPGADAVGKQLESGDGKVETIIGVVDRLPGRHVLMNTVRLAAIVPARPLNTLRYAVATRGEVSPQLLQRIDAVLLQRSAERDVKVESLYQRKIGSMHYLFLFGSILGFISLLLVLVTAIGAYSQASYSVAKRIRQIGTRRAFGASKLHILRYFLLENWLATSMGLLLGLLVANGLSFVLTETMQLPRMGMSQLVLGMLFIWIVGLLSTLLPALRAASVPPAIATRAA